MKVLDKDIVYIYINDCIRWSGGVNILIQIINSLKGSKDINFKIIYVKPSILKNFLNSLRLILRGGGYKNNKIIDEDLLDKFQQYVNENNLKLEILDYSFFKKNFKDVKIFPIMKINSSLKNKKTIGYIPDCQHLHLESFFLKRVIIYRNYQFRRIKKFCSDVYCTSQNVKEDLVKHYMFNPKNIQVTGFMPMRLESQEEKLEKVNEEFFLIANQLWQHKNHIYAIKAFNKTKDENTKLYCTGHMHDHRDGTYTDKIIKLIDELNLNDRIKFLGYLDRKEFIKYLVSCKALIQPTLFEGSPGGFSVADAVAYGVPVLISDIPMNHEVDVGEVKYFDVNNEDSLANLLIDDFEVSLDSRLNQSNILSENAVKKMRRIIKDLIV